MKAYVIYWEPMFESGIIIHKIYTSKRKAVKELENIKTNCIDYQIDEYEVSG